MELRFGSFPQEHHFIQIARPFVEWCFKLIGWLIVAGTIQYGYEKTSNYYLLGLSLFVQLLLLLFVGTFVDWVKKFQFSSKDRPRRQTSLLRQKVGRYFSIFLGIIFTLVAIVLMNTLTAQVIDSVVTFNRTVGR